MRILVIGAGAVGGYLAAAWLRLARCNLPRRARQAEVIREHGLRIVSPHGNATLHPKLIRADEIAGSYDLIILCVKAYSLQAAINDFAPAVGPAPSSSPY